MRIIKNVWVLCVCFFNMIIFSVDGVIEIFRSMDKNFSVCRCAFYLFESNLSAREISIILFLHKHKLVSEGIL